jgi:hypothetical protein
MLTSTGLFERLVPPGVPVDGVVRVLEQIWARLEKESVRVFRPAVRPQVLRPRLISVSPFISRLLESIDQFRVNPGNARHYDVHGPFLPGAAPPCGRNPVIARTPAEASIPSIPMTAG